MNPHAIDAFEELIKQASDSLDYRPEFRRAISNAHSSLCAYRLAATLTCSLWNEMSSAPRDGTKVRLLWPNGKGDVGAYSRDEWSTDLGNAGDAREPVAWLPLEKS